MLNNRNILDITRIMIRQPASLAVVARCSAQLYGHGYEKLGEVYVAIERWMEANGVRPADPPWEWYVTDPGEHPDPNDWKCQHQC